MLPEGKYPLQIGGVSITAEAGEQPWTRVAENEDRSTSIEVVRSRFLTKASSSAIEGIFIHLTKTSSSPDEGIFIK